MWKAPYRPGSDVTQPFGDGKIEVYEVTNTARPGYMPAPGLVLKETLYFETQRLGLNRLYMSRQDQAEVVQVVRTQRRDSVSPQDVAVINGKKQYEIDSVQAVVDVYPPSMDIALRRLEQEYEIPK